MILLGCFLWGQVTYSDALLKAAKAGDASAQRDLGLCYYNGDGIKQNIQEGIKWWLKAAENGDSSAQLNMALAYENADHVPRDSVQAIKWYRKSAEGGNVDAMKMLGDRYGYGDLVTKDAIEADKWWRLAAENGNKEAANMLGLSVLPGTENEDIPQAYKWFSLAFKNSTERLDINYNKQYMEEMKDKLTPEQITKIDTEVDSLQVKIDSKKK